ncbi:MATE family efflux transporter [Desulfofustis glycolicus]|uniref:Multidrug export protein MepA n=1 Tax=Desulfofustis glycolicus DSM 9705 TaxID=1121409 RepID=A0A1M5YGB2_9BACT|nr:MATE family efflux transporter [Desulfofustis glycolicus]SHI11075.1 putative efflux protein, MATE family [Desulfofustis glycolicus DSM 9705]
MTSNDQKLQMMRDEKIPKVLLKMGIPIMIGMLVNALFNVVDAYFVGGLGTSQIGAVSIVFPIVQIVMGLGMAFGSGAGSYTARLLGKGDTEKANITASTALFSSLIVGVISISIAMCFLDNILVALGATETILPYAREYSVIYITGSILCIFNVAMNNIILAEGRSKLTMISMLIGGGLNVILDPIFIFTLNLGIRGAAIATVISQAVTTCLYLWFILSKKGYLRFSPRLFVFDFAIYGEVFKIGIPVLVFQLLASASMGFSNTAASVYGDSAVAAVGVVTRIMAIGTYVVFGFVKGFQPVAGYNFGAKNYNRMDEATKVSLRWATIFCAVAALLMIFIPKQIVSPFSKNDLVLIDIGVRALRANGIIFALFGFQMVYMSLFLAMGREKEGGFLSISRQGLFFIPSILILPFMFGLEGVIWAQPVADFFSVIFTAVLALRLHKQNRVLLFAKKV